MKKIVLSTICIIALLGLVGCDKPSKSSDVMEYLNEEYPNEKFTIIDKEYLEQVEGNCSNKDGYSYIVKSDDTNIEFIVKDIYEESSYGTCNYDLTDNYKLNAMKKYKSEFNDSRILIGESEQWSTKIDVNYEDFNSLDELANILYNFKLFYEDKKPFTKDSEVMVFIHKSGVQLYGFVYLTYNNRDITLSNIQSDIENIINK